MDVIFLKQNVYEIEKNFEKILNCGYTGFLNKNVQNELKRRLGKIDYDIFSPFPEAEKVIFYADTSPEIRLFKINSYKGDVIKHSEVMGSLFGLNITSEMFGDIVWWNGNFYVYLLSSICDLVLDEFRTVGSANVCLEEVSVDYLKDFKREFENIELVVSSLRVDTIVSRLIGCNRDLVGEKVRNQEIFVNDVAIRKVSIVLDTGDVFSVRRYGKFRFGRVVCRTKKDNFVVEINKYI